MSCGSTYEASTRLTYYTSINERSQFKTEKKTEFWPRFGLSVDLRSTAGRPGIVKAAECRSTASRSAKVRELQNRPVDCRSTGLCTGGRVSVDCRSTVPNLELQMSSRSPSRSTGLWTGRPLAQFCARLCISVDCPPWAGRPRF